jgi:hypothetical protein
MEPGTVAIDSNQVVYGGGQEGAASPKDVDARDI